jgi:hypothetical protein
MKVIGRRVEDVPDEHYGHKHDPGQRHPHELSPLHPVGAAVPDEE